jgi:hypothetical protein
MSCIFGKNRDIFFPKLNERVHLTSFADIAVKYLNNMGYKAHLCQNEGEARKFVKTLPQKGQWPCLFTESDTTGEKDFEEFFTEDEVLDMERFQNLGIIKNDPLYDKEKLLEFQNTIDKLKAKGSWQKEDLVNLFFYMIPDFGHKEKGKYLDAKM